MKVLFLILSSFLLGSCYQADSIHVFNGKTMGTYYSVKIVSSDIDKENTKLQIEELLKEVNQVFSTYINTSEVSRINAHRSANPFAVTPVMEQMLQLSFDIYHKSDKFFDPTVGPLVNLWGFGPDGKRYKPSSSEIKKSLKFVGLDKISILNGQLTKREEDIYLDFSSIAKGQGVDDLGLVLESLDFKSYLIEIGGEIRARGKKPDGNFWSIGIEKPSKERGQAVQKVLKLNDESIATSGSYRNYLKYGDALFSHTISPITGYPIEHKLISVSVLDKNCANADAWATALMALGPEKGLDKANQLGLKAYFLVKDNDKFVELASQAFKNR